MFLLVLWHQGLTGRQDGCKDRPCVAFFGSLLSSRASGLAQISDASFCLAAEHAACPWSRVSSKCPMPLPMGVCELRKLVWEGPTEGYTRGIGDLLRYILEL